MLKGLPKAQQKLLAEAVDAGLPPPDQPTSNVVWLAVVGTFLATMLIAVVVLCNNTRIAAAIFNRR